MLLAQFRTQARESGVRGSGSRGLASLPLPPGFQTPQPRFLGPGRNRMRPLEARHSGWLRARLPGPPGPTAGSGRSRAPRSRNKGLSCVLCSAVGGGMSTRARAHTRAHSSPRLRPRGLRSGPDDSRLESGRPQHLPEDSILEGLPGKPTFNLEVVWVSQNFWSVLGTLQTHRSFYKVRHLALKRDVSSIFQHCGGLLSYMSVSEGEKHLSGRTPRVHPERSTLVVKPELNLLIV